MPGKPSRHLDQPLPRPCRRAADPSQRQRNPERHADHPGDRLRREGQGPKRQARLATAVARHQVRARAGRCPAGCSHPGPLAGPHDACLSAAARTPTISGRPPPPAQPPAARREHHPPRPIAPGARSIALIAAEKSGDRSGRAWYRPAIFTSTTVPPSSRRNALHHRIVAAPGIACTSAVPSPGQANTFSTTTVCRRPGRANTSPPMVSAEVSTLGSTWRR